MTGAFSAGVTTAAVAAAGVSASVGCEVVVAVPDELAGWAPVISCGVADAVVVSGTGVTGGAVVFTTAAGAGFGVDLRCFAA